ncbi:hypothetical protein BDB00DRAFT_620330 [Zychaea mexicana]|uniref:uncharacterized protein n=1 Tax=Zychaea mexicana TaxID=64656 RepID=UPI0022FE6154|nr:uncharacterized protein BDB00DRAFT_620330 [Zychaea mexicana]KAI9497350.1 hypothetical protein BDB00DRAFT_620330 [Zychaea mexicana]
MYFFILNYQLTPLRLISDRPQFNEQACQRWFEQYADPDTPNMISPEGMQRFFEDLGLSLEDVLGIVFAWKIKAETMVRNFLRLYYQGRMDDWHASIRGRFDG